MINEILMELYEDYDKNNNIKPLEDFALRTFPKDGTDKLFICSALTMFMKAKDCFRPQAHCNREILYSIVSTVKYKTIDTNYLNVYLDKINATKGLTKYLKYISKDEDIDKHADMILEYLDDFKPNFVKKIKKSGKVKRSITIIGSSSNYREALELKGVLERKGYDVLNYPKLIDRDNIELVNSTYKSFFESLDYSDDLIILNINKNDIGGYIGYETYAELVYFIINKKINFEDTYEDTYTVHRYKKAEDEKEKNYTTITMDDPIKRNIDNNIYLYNLPSEKVGCYDEIMRFLELGYIQLFDKY